jgi:hypothetical protein
VEVTDGEFSEVVAQNGNGVRAVDGFGADGPHDLRQGRFPAWESRVRPGSRRLGDGGAIRRREQRADQERSRERHARRRRLPWPDHHHWQRQRGGEQRAAAERTVDLDAGVVWLAAERRGSRRHAGRFARASSEVRPAARRASAASAYAERRRPSGRVCAGRPSSGHSDVRSSSDQSGRSRYRRHALHRFAELSGSDA